MRLSSIRVVPCVFVALIPLSVAAFSPAFAGQYGHYYTYPDQQAAPSYPIYQVRDHRGYHAGMRVPKSQSRPLIAYNEPPTPYWEHGRGRRQHVHGRYGSGRPIYNTPVTSGLIVPLSAWSAPTITQIGPSVVTTTVQNYPPYAEPQPVVYQTAARCNNPHIIEFSSPPTREEIQARPDVIYLNSTPCRAAQIEYVGKARY